MKQEINCPQDGDKFADTPKRVCMEKVITTGRDRASIARNLAQEMSPHTNSFYNRENISEVNYTVDNYYGLCIISHMNTQQPPVSDYQSQLTEQLNKLRSQSRPEWKVTASAIMNLKKNKDLWPFEGARNFTDWVSLHSREFGVGESTLRSYVLVAEYYLFELSPKFTRWGIERVPFDELPKHIGPEMLVDLKKIAKVGSEQAEEHFAKMIMSNNCRYVDIRNAWLAYRKTIKVNPHQRGRLSIKELAPKHSQTGALFETKVVDVLLTDKGFWSKNDELQECAVIQNYSSLFSKGEGPDLILAVKDSEKSLRLHGVEIKSTYRKSGDERLPQWAEYFDKVWLALESLDNADHLKNGFGVLELINQGISTQKGYRKIKVYKEGAPTDMVGKSTELLLRSMLAKKIW